MNIDQIIKSAKTDRTAAVSAAKAAGMSEDFIGAIESGLEWPYAIVRKMVGNDKIDILTRYYGHVKARLGLPGLALLAKLLELPSSVAEQVATGTWSSKKSGEKTAKESKSPERLKLADQKDGPISFVDQEVSPRAVIRTVLSKKGDLLNTVVIKVDGEFIASTRSLGAISVDEALHVWETTFDTASTVPEASTPKPQKAKKKTKKGEGPLKPGVTEVEKASEEVRASTPKPASGRKAVTKVCRRQVDRNGRWRLFKIYDPATADAVNYVIETDGPDGKTKISRSLETTVLGVAREQLAAA